MSDASLRREKFRRKIALTEEIYIEGQCSDIAPKIVTVEVPGIQGPPGKDGADGKPGELGKPGEGARVESIENSFIDNLF